MFRSQVVSDVPDWKERGGETSALDQGTALTQATPNATISNEAG
jgi:hypothetical protein